MKDVMFARRSMAVRGLAALALTLGSVAPCVAQSTRAATVARPWVAPRTPEGHPDFQGVWDFRSLTPLERSTEFADKERLSTEEAAAFEKRSVDARVDRAPRSGDPGTYNQFWFDFGTKVDPSQRTSLVVNPANGRLPALTPEGQKRQAENIEVGRRAAEGPEDRPLWERCILGFNAGPPIMPNGYNNNLQIVQTRDYVVIHTEMVHDARIVPIGNRPNTTLASLKGESRGRWEGDTLVIETRNFTNWGTGTIGLRVRLDDHLRLVERFTRTAADTLVYEFTVDDPTIWTAPWTVSTTMKQSAEQIYEYACHEGNYGLRGILAGARQQERDTRSTTPNK